MSYFNAYKKRLNSNGGSVVGERIKDTEKFVAMNFKDDPSYRDSKIVNTDLSVSDIGVRIANIDKSVYEKRIHMMPNQDLNVGNYIFFEHKNKKHIYLIDEVEDNSIPLYGKATECKNTLVWKDSEGTVWKFPCVVSYQSYGVKIFQSTNEFVSESSTNIDIEVPRNSITDKMPLNHRIMFGNSSNGIFKIGDIAVYVDNKLKLTCKKDKYMEGYDDLENNLAYNGTTETIPPADYTLEGEDEIKINQVYQYKLFPSVGNPMWKLDDYTAMNNLAELSLVDAYTVEVKGLKQGEFIELICEVSGAILKKEIIIVR